ncbi:MAG: hypothetical protein AB7F74_11610 [Parvibaculaceae bacterium]
MSKFYLQPEQMEALVEVFHEARRLLLRRGITNPRELDAVAHHILHLAYAGVPPWLILGEIMPPMSPEDAGLPYTAERIDLETSNRWK